jgi:hypothetical protein
VQPIVREAARVGGMHLSVELEIQGGVMVFGTVPRHTLDRENPGALGTNIPTGNS